MIQESGTTLPRINEPAPAFEAETTHGSKTLEGYRENGWCKRPTR